MYRRTSYKLVVLWIGIIKEILGFRQFSLRSLLKAAGEWNLVCIGYNLKRLHTLLVS